MTRYKEITDFRIQERIRDRYRVEIPTLEGLGFSLLAYNLEMRAPFSMLWHLPILPLMRQAREVLVFPFPLRLGTANVLFVSIVPSTVVECMGLGVKSIRPSLTVRC